MENAGWIFKDGNKVIDENGNFDVIYPLSIIFGLHEKFDKVIVNVSHIMEFVRSNTDTNAIIQDGDTDESFKFTLNKFEWCVPNLIPSDPTKISLLKQIEKDNPIKMGYHSYEIFEYPSLPLSTKTVDCRDINSTTKATVFYCRLSNK